LGFFKGFLESVDCLIFPGFSQGFSGKIRHFQARQIQIKIEKSTITNKKGVEMKQTQRQKNLPYPFSNKNIQFHRSYSKDFPTLTLNEKFQWKICGNFRKK
jgi:hypothetical protein